MSTKQLWSVAMVLSVALSLTSRSEAQGGPPVAPSGAPKRWQVKIGDSRLAYTYPQPVGVQPTRDGGFLVFGRYAREVAGPEVAFAMRLAGDGTLVRTTAYDRTGRFYFDAIPTDDGGFVLIPGLADVYDPEPVALKLRSDGSVSWQTPVLPKPGFWGPAVWAKAADGAIYVAVSGPGSMFVDRIEANGTLGWSELVDTDSQSLHPDPAGGFYLARGARVQRVDAGGRVVWDRVVDPNVYIEGAAIPAPNGGLLLWALALHRPGALDGGLDPYFFLVDPQGNTTWRARLSDLKDASPQHIVPTDGGWFIELAPPGLYPGDHILVAFLDSSGRLRWTRDVPLHYTDHGLYPRQSLLGSGGSLFMLGLREHQQGVQVLKIGRDGKPRWDKVYNAPPGSNYAVVAPTLDDGVLLASTELRCDDELATGAMRIRADGRAIWARTYARGLPLPCWDFPYVSAAPTGIATADGGFLIGGVNGNSIQVVKTDALGNTVPVKTLTPPP